MIEYDPKSNRLKRWEPSRRYQILDVETPNLYRDIFPYDTIPKIVFDGKILPMRLPSEIWITDTTFRDGQQARPPYTVKQIVDLYDLLHRLDGDMGLIRQSEFFLYTEKDRESVRQCKARGYRYPEVTAWIRATMNDLELVKSLGLKEAGILTSISDYHIFRKLQKTRSQAITGYLDVVKATLEAGIIPRCHFEDMTRADYQGVVLPFAQSLMELSVKYKMPVKIRVCDTMGFAIEYPGTALPRAVDKSFAGLLDEAGVPGAWLEWHGHNDFYRSVANSTAAWLAGCCGVNAALLGTGERTGNTPLEAMVIEYIELTGKQGNIDTTAITDIARYMARETAYEIPANQPFVGLNFNVTRAGIHADGLLKDEEIYNVFDTKKLLKRPVDVGITDKSGAAGIAYWIDSRLGLEGDRKIGKGDPAIARIRDWVDRQYAAGRSQGISEEEMWEAVRRELPALVAQRESRAPSAVV